MWIKKATIIAKTSSNAEIITMPMISGEFSIIVDASTLKMFHQEMNKNLARNFFVLPSRRLNENWMLQVLLSKRDNALSTDIVCLVDK